MSAICECQQVNKYSNVCGAPEAWLQQSSSVLQNPLHACILSVPICGSLCQLAKPAVLVLENGTCCLHQASCSRMSASRKQQSEMELPLIQAEHMFGKAMCICVETAKACICKARLTMRALNLVQIKSGHA